MQAAKDAIRLVTMSTSTGMLPPSALTVPHQPVRAEMRLHRDEIILILLVLLGELPLLIKYFSDLWSRPQYGFYPLILIGAAYLAWDRLRDGAVLESSRLSHQIGAVLLAAAFLLLAAGVVLLIRWLGGVSAWLALAGCVCWIGGAKLLRTMVPTLVLLLTIIPPPGRQDEAIALSLRQWAVWASGVVLDLVKIPHVNTGTLINVMGHRLGVEDACSGIHSLMAVVAVTLMLGFYWHRPAWRIVTITLCSIVFVIWANVLRIAIGAYLVEAWKIDILSGSAHELLGLVLFIICIALSASLDQFLLILRPERERTDQPPQNPFQKLRMATPSPGSPGEGRGEGDFEHQQQPTSEITLSRSTGRGENDPRAWTGRAARLLGWGIAGAFVALGLVSQYRVAGLWRPSSLSDSAQFNMPATLAGWERVEGSEQVIGRPEILAPHSAIWSYRQGSRSVLVAFDYPFPGYHELATCYLASGWKITAAAQKGTRDTAGADGLYTKMRMERPSPAYAYLLYGCCDEQGRWLGPENLGNVDSLKLAFALSYQKAKAPQAYQVQVLMQGFAPTTEEDRKRVEQLFLAARAQFVNQLLTQVGGAK
jgi:exosortase